MKKILTYVFLLLAVCNTAFAESQFKDYFKPENWVPQTVQITLGNDKWAIGGLSYNWDDQLSYSERLYVRAPSWSFTVDWMGITNRGWQKGWDIKDYSKLGDGNRIQGRYDELQVYLGLPTDIIDEDRYWLWASPEFGFSLAGNQNHVWIQNLSHIVINKVAEVHIPYEIEGNIINPIIRGDAEFGFIFKDYNQSFLFTAIRASHYETIGFSRQNKLTAVFGITNEYEDVLTFSAGYAWNKPLSGWFTQDLYYQYINGWTYSILVNTGVFSIGYTTLPSKDIGYGTLSLDLLGFTKKSSWKESDINYAIGLVFQLNNTFYCNEIGIPLKGTRWDLYISDRFFSGDPSFKGWEIGLDHDKFPRYKRSYGGLFFGGKINFELKKEDAIVLPYAKTGVGVMKWEVRTIRNMQTEHNGEVNLIHSTTSKTLYSIGSDFELGLTFFPEGTLTTSNTSFQLNLFAGMTAILNPNKVTKYLEEETEDGLRISRFIPRWGVSIEMDFDI